jgi:signal peptidase I
MPAARPAAPPVIPANQPIESFGQPVTPSVVTTAPTIDGVQPAASVIPPVARQPQPAAEQIVRPASFELPELPDVLPGEKKIVKPHQGLRDVLSIVGVLASALLLAFCLITFVFQSYQVDGPSMQTTLHNNDHLIVWKVPQTFAKLTGKHYIPKRGDIIVFNEPKSANGGIEKQLIKRVIGLPGDRVVVKDDALTIYNEQYPNGYSPDKEMEYGKVITSTPGNVDVVVKDGQVFASGDNRPNSLDSRAFGPIDSDEIVGKLVLRVLPLNSVTRY